MSSILFNYHVQCESSHWTTSSYNTTSTIVLKYLKIRHLIILFGGYMQSIKKLDSILIIDGIAIFFIVLFHESAWQTNISFLGPYLVTMGLSLFTFSSGYKLILNHKNSIGSKKFLKEYYFKRFIRLYKPYLGYTFLILFPSLLCSYIAENYFHLTFPGIMYFKNLSELNLFSFILFLFGQNPITIHLWYLVSLIVITSISFIILYFFNIKGLFISFIPFCLIALLMKFKIIDDITQIGYFFKFFTYLPFFIFGCYWGYIPTNISNQWKRMKVFEYSLPICFFGLMIFTIFSQNFIDRSILIYLGSFLFPIFLLSNIKYVQKLNFIYYFLIFCGTYSFQIYLFHLPLILAIVSRVFINILKIDHVVVSLIISIITIIFCVTAYKFSKLLRINILFE
jgi:peptidoglycan/LPS O-acetylase OafA/YrhL